MDNENELTAEEQQRLEYVRLEAEHAAWTARYAPPEYGGDPAHRPKNHPGIRNTIWQLDGLVFLAASIIDAGLCSPAVIQAIKNAVILHEMERDVENGHITEQAYDEYVIWLAGDEPEYCRKRGRTSAGREASRHETCHRVSSLPGG